MYIFKTNLLKCNNIIIKSQMNNSNYGDMEYYKRFDQLSINAN